MSAKKVVLPRCRSGSENGPAFRGFLVARLFYLAPFLYYLYIYIYIYGHARRHPGLSVRHNDQRHGSSNGGESC